MDTKKTKNMNTKKNKNKDGFWGIYQKKVRMTPRNSTPI